MSYRYKNYMIRLYESKYLQKINPFVKYLIVLMPVGSVGMFFILFGNEQWDFSDYGVNFGMACTAIWMYCSQMIIRWFYDRVNPDFWQSVSKAACNKCQVDELGKRLYRLEGKLYRYLWLPVFLLFILPAIVGIEALGIVQVEGFSDPKFYFTLVALGFTSSFALVFVVEIIKMIVSTYWVSKHIDSKFDYLHEDNVGGFGYYGTYSFRVTKGISSGVLFLPIVFAYGATNFTGSIVFSIILVSVLTVALFASIIIPILIGYNIADSLKEETIKLLGKDRDDCLVECIANPVMELKIKWQSLDKRIEVIQATPTFPFEINTVARIIVTSLTPIGIFIVQLYVTPENIRRIVEMIV